MGNTVLFESYLRMRVALHLWAICVLLLQYCSVISLFGWRQVRKCTFSTSSNLC